MSIKVGITMRVLNEYRYKETRDSISRDWISFFDSHNIDFVLIPNSGDSVVDFIKHKKIKTLILSNGNDIINENLNSKSNDTSKMRDYTERILIDYALKNKIKILGICRGAQMLNIYFGGYIVFHDTENHVAKIFEKKLIDKDTINFIKEKKIMTNCFHRYFIEKSSLSTELIPFAMSDKKYVEGFYHKQKEIVGIQWHPERTFAGNNLSEKIAISFLKNGPWWKNN